ncbi:MAG: PqqD family protein [Planctomycetota bacterium]|nr:MAG: PqqD family protein [Planctomycetota bacterium]REJ90399.1 MAG: PqqD family protein [Planctomycetota bacterium]
MDELQCVRPNSQDVAAKVIDDEAILINVATGAYYSMDNVGAFIWKQIDAQCPLEAIVAAVVARYDVTPEQADTDVQRVARELFEENLVVACDLADAKQAEPCGDGDAKSDYVSPTLGIYRDMATLLALDPPSPVLIDGAWSSSDGEVAADEQSSA